MSRKNHAQGNSQMMYSGFQPVSLISAAMPVKICFWNGFS